MSNVHVASYYANRFDPDTLFPELVMIKSSDVFYGTDLKALNIQSLEFEPKFEGTYIDAVYVKDVVSDLPENFLPEGNPLLVNQVTSQLANASMMATLGLTYLTSPQNYFNLANQVKSLDQPTATYSNDYALKSCVSQLDYMTNTAFELKSENPNQFVHAGYKFFLINTIEPMEINFESIDVPTPIFIRESVLTISISI